MVPNLGLDMTGLLVGFCSLAVGFVLVGLIALLALVIEDGSRRKRAFSRVDVAGNTTSERTVCSVDRTHAAA